MTMFRSLATTLLVAFCLLVLASSDALAFGRRCRCESQGQSCEQAQRPGPVRRAIAALVGHPGAGSCQAQQFAPAPQFAWSATRESACQFGTCEGPGSACFPPASACPNGQCRTQGPFGRIVLAAPLPTQACPNGKCPLPR